MSTLRSILAGVVAAILVAGYPTRADAGVPAVPSQEHWQAAKRTVELPGGQRIAYLDLGDPSLPALILLHGYTDSSRTWSLMAGDLVRHRRLIIPDARGHGDSSRPDCCYAYADMARDVIELADSLGIDRFDLAGHSMGSMVAQHVAAAQPKRVATLALYGSTVSTPIERGSEIHRAVHELRAPLKPSGEGFLKDWLRQTELVPSQPDFTTPFQRETLSVPAPVWHRLVDTFAEPVGANLASIKARVVTLSGENDPFFGAGHQAGLRAAFPRATHCLLRAGGHNMPFEDPAWSASRLSAFLAGAETPSDCATGH